MYEPDYTEYSLNQLYDCLQHINSEKYPRRFEKLQKEIELRTEMGETFSDKSVEQFLAADVPFSLGLRAWWCFIWRSGIAAMPLVALYTGLVKINTVFQLLPPLAMTIFQATYWILGTAAAGTCIMMQVLAKEYSGYRIRIVRKS